MISSSADVLGMSCSHRAGFAAVVADSGRGRNRYEPADAVYRNRILGRNGDAAQSLSTLSIVQTVRTRATDPGDAGSVMRR